MSSSAKQYLLPFLKKEKLAENTYSFYFDTTNNPIDFIPGQYMKLILPHENPDDRGTSRYFTISSAPHEKEHLMITTKIPQSTFKKALANLEPGADVHFFGPIGYFIEKIDSNKPFVFLAGGIGITPFYSLFKHATHTKLPHAYTLFASFSQQEDIIFHKELTDLMNKNQKLKIIYTVTNQETPGRWPNGLLPGGFEKGRLSESLLKKHLTNLQQHNYYIVGPPGMVEETKQMLEHIGIASDQIFTEDFTGY